MFNNFKQKADLYSSGDPEVLTAGIGLFEGTQEKKTCFTRGDVVRRVATWFLKYTHPTSAERISYLKKALKKQQTAVLTRKSI